jgi:hypothetical protein
VTLPVSWYLFFAPKIIGGSSAVPVVGGIGAASVADALPLRDLKLRRFDDDIMIEGYLKDSALFAARKNSQVQEKSEQEEIGS